MRTVLLLLLAYITTVPFYAQQFSGIATYASQRKLDIKLDSTQLSDEMQQQMQAMLQKQMEKEFELTFNQHESTYKEKASLESPSNMASSGGLQIMVAGSGGNDERYKNLKESRFTNQVELFGKQFLIKDSLEIPAWELHKESKNIGEYVCFKATYTTTRTVRAITSSSDEKEENTSTQMQEEPVLVTAWYTPQIPIGHGPADYHGLPGLILEVNDGKETILCSKIVLQPEAGVSIKEPKKGKVVSEAEYDEIVDKKMKEFQEQRHGGKGRNIEIRIGG